MANDPDDSDELDAAQRDGLGDMDPERFRAAAHDVVDAMADYLAGVESRAVLPSIEPGSIRPAFPASPPRIPSRWRPSSPTSTGSCSPTRRTGSTPGSWPTSRPPRPRPGILGEMWTAVLGQNPMLWRTSPIGTELEQVVVGWLREALGPAGALRRAAHRHRLDLDAHRPRGRPRGRRAARGGGRPRRPGRRRAPGRLRLDRGAQQRREGLHDPGPRPGSAAADPCRRRLRHAGRPAGGRDRGGPGGRRRPDRHRGDDRHDLVDLGRPGGGDRRHRRPRGALAPRRRRLRRRGRARARRGAGRSPAGSGPTRSSSTPTSGSSRRSTRRSS